MCQCLFGVIYEGLDLGSCADLSEAEFSDGIRHPVECFSLIFGVLLGKSVGHRHLTYEFEYGGFGHARQSLFCRSAVFHVANFVGEIGDDKRRHRRSKGGRRLGDEGNGIETDFQQPEIGVLQPGLFNDDAD